MVVSCDQLSTLSCYWQIYLLLTRQFSMVGSEITSNVLVYNTILSYNSYMFIINCIYYRQLLLHGQLSMVEFIITDNMIVYGTRQISAIIYAFIFNTHFLLACLSSLFVISQLNTDDKANPTSSSCPDIPINWLSSLFSTTCDSTIVRLIFSHY